MKLEYKKFQIGNFILGIPENIGPRILHFSFKDYPERNIFGILPEIKIETEEGDWHIFGGHRVWTSPEAKPRSYSLDNQPVKIEEGKGYIKIYGNPEIKNSVQKEIEIREKNGKIEVIHKIKNIGRWPLKFSVWCLSVMKKGGFAIIPVKPKKVDKDGLLPDRNIVLWQYTELSDKRLFFGKEYIFIKQDEKIEKPVKIGTKANPSFTGYYNENSIFIKIIEETDEEYPDFGCNVEVYTNSEFLELETLSSLKTVQPEEYIEHTEIWDLIPVEKIELDEKKIDEIFKNYFARG